MVRRLFLLAIILALLTPLCAQVDALAGEPMPLGPAIYISTLNPSNAHVSVTADSVGHVTFHANVTVDKPPLIGTVMVNLDGKTNTGWTTVVSPQSIPFTSSSTVEITISVVVPQATPIDEIGRTEVHGLATYPGGSKSATSTGTIVVDQYFGCALNATPRLGTGNPQVFKIEVFNKGNGLDSFSLSVLAREALSQAGLSFYFYAITTEKIPMDENQTVKIRVSYDANAAPGKKDFYVRAISDGSKNVGNDSVFIDCLLTIDVQPLSSPQGMSLGIAAGAIIVAVGVTLFVAKKKGKLKFGKKAKDANKDPKEK